MAVTSIGLSNAWMVPRQTTTRLTTSKSTTTDGNRPSFHLLAVRNNNNNNNNNNIPKAVDKGFNLLELASQVVPQGRIVQTAKESWKFLWQRFMVELAPQDRTGAYQRPSYTFGNTLGSTKYPLDDIYMNPNQLTIAAGNTAKNLRYQLYLGNPCPWCHRVKLVVNVLNLQDVVVGVTQLVDDPIKASRGGWVFDTPPPQAPQIQDLRQLYQLCEPGYQGRCTAPVLVDWKTKSIVSNESKQLVRMLPLLLHHHQSNPHQNHKNAIDLCPAALQSQIDETNDWIYQCINNGVYQCGFATTQEAYDRASSLVRQGLDRCEQLLQMQPYLCGQQFTESDIFLLPTMLRFDAVYAPLFGAGGSRHWRLAVDFPHIHQWMKRCWQHASQSSSIGHRGTLSGNYFDNRTRCRPLHASPSEMKQ